MEEVLLKYKALALDAIKAIADNSLLVATILFVTFFGWLFVNLHNRHKFYSKLPGPPHSFFFGHALALGECTKAVPSDAHPQVLISEVCRRYNLWGAFYLNIFPFKWEPMLVIADGEFAAQVTQVPGGGPPKHGDVSRIIGPFTGTYGIITMEGSRHKALRSIYNPGFSAKNLMELVPDIVDESVVFVSCLAKAASGGKPVPVDSLATKVTFDIMGRVVLGASFKSQTGGNALVDTFLALFKAQGAYPTSPADPRRLINIRRSIMGLYYGRTINRLCREAIVQRLGDAKKEAASVDKGKVNGPKLIVDLALKEYMNTKDADGMPKPGKLIQEVDEMFLTMSVDNIKSFLFAGHDTTSSTITYSLYLLSEHLEILKKVREEHDQVLGTDWNAAAEKICAEPAIVNQLVLTQAVVKETLRIFPPASSAREGSPDVVLKSPKTGELYPTAGHLLWVVNHCSSRDPEYFPNPSHFIPERFLPSPPPPLPAIPQNAWRPFEKGLRNCIGQELAMLESKIILALSVRRFDFEAAFGKGKGNWKTEVAEGNGVVRYPEDAHQVLIVTAKPKNGLPMRVIDRAAKST